MCPHLALPFLQPLLLSSPFFSILLTSIPFYVYTYPVHMLSHFSLDGNQQLL
jgi:hypothetical protein